MYGESDKSYDSVSGRMSPPKFVTPRIPINRSSPLSTKREKLARTPQYRRTAAPKIIKTVPSMKSLYASSRYRTPRSITKNGKTIPLSSPIYNNSVRLSYFEQCFKIDSIIGKGSFGEVFAVQSLEDSQKYAVKVSINVIRQNCANKYREVENHMNLPKHPNLVEFVNAWEEGGKLYIQQELCQKSLLQHCIENHALPEEEIWNILIDLINAVHHLHSHDMVHDDIKPENIFLTNNGICKLGDFGLVINLKNPKDVQTAEEGDSKYLAPEVLNGKPSKASDIFSLGMTILEAATDLDIPSNGDSWHLIREGKIPDRFFHGISPQLRRLIVWMLSSDAKVRPTAEDLLRQSCIHNRLLKRKLFVGFIGMSQAVANWSFIIFTWWIALFTFIVYPPLAAFSAVCKRRSSICAFTITKNHTPIHTPEAHKVFASNFHTGAAFDFSDDENYAQDNHSLKPLPILNLDLADDDDVDENEIATSSSNSSTIDSAALSSPSDSNIIESPNKRKVAFTFNDRIKTTPPSARKSNLRCHRGNGDYSGLNKRLFGDLNTEEEKDNIHDISVHNNEKWQQSKYERMRRMEESLDSDDNDAVVNDFTRNSFAPKSCPSFRNGKSLRGRAPPLNFSLLDDDAKDDSIRKNVVRKGCAFGDSSADED